MNLYQRQRRMGIRSKEDGIQRLTEPRDINPGKTSGPTSAKHAQVSLIGRIYKQPQIYPEKKEQKKN